jgi:hypothetical protein
MDHLDISYQLNSNSYRPLEYGGCMTSTIRNKTTHTMLVTRVGLSFDWKVTGFFYKDCIKEIQPGASESLPEIPFQIGLQASVGTHEYRAGVIYKLLIKSIWAPQSDGILWCEPCKHILVEKAKERDFEVFVSHSNAAVDVSLLKMMETTFKDHGIKIFVAEQKPEPGHILWKKIDDGIRSADAVLVLWTKNGSKSGDIREEIGLAVGANKTEKIIALVQAHLKTRGSLIGREHIPLDMTNPIEAMTTGISRFIEMANEKEKTKTDSNNLSNA